MILVVSECSNEQLDCFRESDTKENLTPDIERGRILIRLTDPLHAVLKFIYEVSFFIWNFVYAYIISVFNVFRQLAFKPPNFDPFLTPHKSMKHEHERVIETFTAELLRCNPGGEVLK